MMNAPIIIRLDDVCPQMDFCRFKKYIDLFESLGVKPLLGVIPDCRDASFKNSAIPDFWKYIHELKENGYSISIHGYRHVYTSKSNGLVCRRPLSEFAGLSYEDQLALLSNGRSIMLEHGLDVDTFMPPGHSYDHNTLKAMYAAGFRYLTDGRSLRPYDLDGIRCIPAAPAARLHKLGLFTIRVHTETESDRDFEWLRTFLEKNKSHIISFDKAKSLKVSPYWLCRIEEHLALWIYYKFIPSLSKLLRRK